MGRQLFYSLIFALLSTTAIAQLPDICKKPEKMQSFCKDACIICDINGFTGRNDVTTVGQVPPGFCTGTAHHIQWIGFVAGTPNITLSIRAFNCTRGGGLEAGIYESFDCNTIRLVSNCNGGFGPNASATFRNTAPLIVGQHYYLVMDGNNDDVCDYTVTVLEGSTKLAPLTTSGEITGLQQVCPGLPQTYNTTPQTGAIAYVWSVNGVEVKGQIKPTLTYTFSTEGDYEISVKAENVCFEAPPAVHKVTVKTIEPLKLKKTLCLGESWKVGDSTFYKTGVYQLRYKTKAGCDSLVEADLTVLTATKVEWTYTLCSTDAFKFGDKTYNKAGKYTETFKNQYNCDSTVTLNLKTVVCKINGSTRATDVDCWGTKTGQLVFNVQNGEPPFQYSWEKVGEKNIGGKGVLNALRQDVTVSSLNAGKYIVTIYNALDTVILQKDITEPTRLRHTFQTSAFGKHQLSCANGNNGQITINPNGGTPPYSFKWNPTNTNTKTISNLKTGTYAYTITDAKNCPLDSSITLTAPPPLVLALSVQNLSCEGLTSGKIEVKSASGGTEPYQYAFNASSFSASKIYTKLGPGRHTVTLKDAFGCLMQQTEALTAPDIPSIEAGQNQHILLGDSLRLSAQGSLYKTIKWTPANTLDCSTCITTVVKPIKTSTYTIEVTSKDGCKALDSLQVTVEIIRKFYAPNAFSPDEDGDNNRFTIFGTRLIKSIKYLRIYDRWGEQVFSGQDLKPSDTTKGWDGSFKGRPLPGGVFVWMAEITFLDDETLLYEGDVHLIR